MKTISILKKLKWFYAIALSIWLFVSCDVLSAIGGSALTETYSLIPTEGLSTTHIPNEEFFYVNLHAAYYIGEGFDALDSIIYAMDDGPGTDCKIPVEQESTEDLYCIMDVMEGDLWFHNIVLQYNVPAGMCDYLDFDVPWHFNQKIGYGPQSVYTCNRGSCQGGTTGGEPTLETETEYCLETCTVQQASELGDCEAQEDVTYSRCGGIVEREDPQNFCGTLDKSENDLANCCLGDYNLYDVESSVGKSGTHSEAKWGGNVKDCIGGLGRTNWNSFNHAGFPITEVTATLKEGHSSTYEMPALIDKYEGHKNADKLNKSPTFINANYWTDVENKEFTDSPPSFYKAPRAGTQMESHLRTLNELGYPYLSWTCLDKAREIKHRINLVIREWNTQEEYNSYKETSGGRGDPDVVGAEGSICDYYESEEEAILKDTDCNDFADVDDWDALDHGTGVGYNAYPEVIYQ
jgi:hypothetical protein